MAANIWALVKAVPTLYKWFKDLQELYIKEQIENINEAHITKEDEKIALLGAIENATSNKQIMAHSITLHRLNAK